MIVDALSTTSAALVTVRVGNPMACLTAERKSAFRFLLRRGMVFYMRRVYRRFDAIRAAFEQARKPPLLLPDNSDIYSKRTKNDPQDPHIRLSISNFAESAQHRWSCHMQSTTAHQELVFEFFFSTKTQKPVSRQTVRLKEE